MNGPYDVCIVGSGASGSVAADVLVRAGLRVLMIEEGRPVTRETNAEVDAQSPLCKAREPDGTFSRNGWPWTSRNVGGGTVFYGGVSFRYQEIDFDVSSALDCEIETRWPYGLGELEPYYRAIEDRLGVTGGGTDPSPGGYTLSPGGEILWEVARGLGWTPFRTPLAIRFLRPDGTPWCDQARHCMADGVCATGAKSDAVVTFLEPLRAHGERFRLRPGTKAARLLQDSSGSISALECLDLDTGRSLRISAKCYVLAANPIQTAALLLRSTSRFAPRGVGNDNDLVGRTLCMKQNEYVQTRIEARRPHDPLEGPCSTVSVLDHYRDEGCPGGIGGLIYEMNPTVECDIHLAADEQLLRLECLVPDTPCLTNRVRLDDEPDASGLPGLVIDYTPQEEDNRRRERIIGHAKRLLHACGGREIERESTYFWRGSAHLHGTCRFGATPQEGVVHHQGRVHGYRNLFVVDGSFMPYPGGLNPTLTIQAHALKTSSELAAGFDW